MKKYLLLPFILLSLSLVYSQQITIEKNKVFLNKTQIFKLDNVKNLYQFSVYDLNNKEILLYRDYTSYNTNFFSLHFISDSIKIQSTNYVKIHLGSMSTKKIIIKLLEWLISEKVINRDGTINLKELNAFKFKYDETELIKQNNCCDR